MHVQTAPAYTAVLSTGLLERIGTRTVAEDTRRLGDIGLIGGTRPGVAATPTPTDVTNADPLAGSAFIRTTTIAKRLEDPKSKEARDYLNRVQQRIVLINGERLARLMVQHEVGVRARKTYVLRSIDEDYFSEA